MNPRSSARRYRRAGLYRGLAALFLSTFGLCAVTARADVNSVTTTPTATSVAITQTTTVAVTWQMIRDNTAHVGPTVTSTHGVFRAGTATGPVLGVVNTTLSASRAVTGTHTVFSIKETVPVPRGIAYQALKLGQPMLVYLRTFVDCPACTSGTGAIVLPLTGVSGAAFSISRLSLRFDDDSAVRIVEQGSKLGAYADLSFTGSGILKGVWEIAAPPDSNSKKPQYRRLGKVVRALADGERVRLSTPALPTDTAGPYLLRLRITQPELPLSHDELPLIRYVVVAAEPAAGAGAGAREEAGVGN